MVFFSFFSAFFSLAVLAGFFFCSFCLFRPLAMATLSRWVATEASMAHPVSAGASACDGGTDVNPGAAVHGAGMSRYTGSLLST
ncbi:hypothetical protein DSI35_17485, partial [Mycobacterium tuberculosis]